MRYHKMLIVALTIPILSQAAAQTIETVVDIPTRPGVTQRMILLMPRDPKAAVVLFAGDDGGLEILSNGSILRRDQNFLVRSRQLFAQQGLVVAVIDAPSDRQTPPFLRHFRRTPEHAADIKAVISWLRETVKVPVWLVGTSRGTVSVAYAAIELNGPEGPDGIVLSSTILKQEGRAVPEMPLERIRVPVLVVHHERDGCKVCSFADIPTLMAKLQDAPQSRLLSFTGGIGVGDPCRSTSNHGYYGIEAEVVQQTAAWLLDR